MQELNMVEVDEVGGGILQALAWGMFIYGVVDVIYDFNKGVADAKSGKA